MYKHQETEPFLREICPKVFSGSHVFFCNFLALISTIPFQTLSPTKQPLPPINKRQVLQDEIQNVDEENNHPEEQVQDSKGVGVDGGKSQKKVKVPRRLIHCSDGIYEEYSTDEEELEQEMQEEERRLRNIDPKKLGWIAWMFHYTWLGGSSFLGYADYWGEKLAW